MCFNNEFEEATTLNIVLRLSEYNLLNGVPFMFCINGILVYIRHEANLQYMNLLTHFALLIEGQYVRGIEYC